MYLWYKYLLSLISHPLSLISFHFSLFIIQIFINIYKKNMHIVYILTWKSINQTFLCNYVIINTEMTELEPKIVWHIFCNSNISFYFNIIIWTWKYWHTPHDQFLLHNKTTLCKTPTRCWDTDTKYSNSNSNNLMYNE